MNIIRNFLPIIIHYSIHRSLVRQRFGGPQSLTNETKPTVGNVGRMDDLRDNNNLQKLQNYTQLIYTSYFVDTSLVGFCISKSLVLHLWLPIAISDTSSLPPWRPLFLADIGSSTFTARAPARVALLTPLALTSVVGAITGHKDPHFLEFQFRCPLECPVSCSLFDGYLVFGAVCSVFDSYSRDLLCVCYATAGGCSSVCVFTLVAGGLCFFFGDHVFITGTDTFGICWCVNCGCFGPTREFLQDRPD